MAETADQQGCNATPARRECEFDFEEFIARLRGRVTIDQIDAASRKLLDADDLFETVLRESQPLPAHYAMLAEEVRHAFDQMRAGHAQLREYVAASLDPSAAKARTATPCEPQVTQSFRDLPRNRFEPFAEMIMTFAYWHLVERSGRDAAEAELRAIVKRLTRKPRGRPRSRPVSQVQEAKRLRDEGLSHGQIAIRCGFPSEKHARAALKHDFPDQATKKKSR